jgi:hypothetical protein
VKNPKRVAAGRINGLKSGKARRARAAEHALERKFTLSTRDRRILAGRCIDCGERPPAGMRLRCAPCAAAVAEKTRAHYQANADRYRKMATARYHAKNPEARYWGPRKKAA